MIKRNLISYVINGICIDRYGNRCEHNKDNEYCLKCNVMSGNSRFKNLFSRSKRSRN